MVLPWFLCIVLLLIVAALVIKIWLLKRSMKEICRELMEHFAEDTNVLLSTSTRDVHVRQLTAELNQQLRLLREQRQKYLTGDRELKMAVTNISHDLRTPLTAIFGYLELLEQEEKSPAVADYLSVIENRAEVLKQLTEEFFYYSVASTPEKQAVKEKVVLNQLLEESLAGAYAELMVHNITPVVQMPEQKVVRWLNPSAVSRVFANLIANAVKYSDGDLEITLTEAGEITFTNTASQLDDVQAGKLFDRFYTVETATKSTGLGLTITRALVEQLGGSITMSYEDKQLSIRVKLPE
ncbi:HAMP domain-containing histidine kinase [Enterococcus sp. 669A]|uniref:histidine kinase n=1 Tax=Candidatus Enterococcus moelleringii TaxID=2815325 RepID=A0ABS3L580_9ENTE|nr:HAMP domain-containing sensor histidine kinase [Enterococcus sp. 669A]MBO1304730.1 HAMP domain-containing histidine kinase [Enterococcus sp. 669A]